MNTARSAPVSPDPFDRHSLSAQEIKQIIFAARAGEPFLLYRDDARALRTFALLASQSSLSIGRRDGVNLRLAWDPEVSGVHAELRFVAGEWLVIDNGRSRNGTFLNGRRVTGDQRLREGDLLRCGKTLLAFKEPRQAASEAPDETSPALPDGHPGAADLTVRQRAILVALCRPLLADGDHHALATNPQIAAEVFLGIDAVKTQLHTLFIRFGLEHLPQNQKRAALADIALREGLVIRRDL